MSGITRRLTIDIEFRDDRPELLWGLAQWLDLGLLRLAQVKALSRNYLSCPLPSVLPPPLPATPPVRERVTTRATRIPETQRTNNITKIWESFQQELSVRWLLFLGLFLVVISSAVLVARVWQNFPSSLQYSILWLYSLLFWGIGRWAGQSGGLVLTARTLQIIGILLIPLNFWGMDNFGIIGSWGGSLIAIAATVSLTGIYLKTRGAITLGSSARTISPSDPLPGGEVWQMANFLLLSYCHWGWGLSRWPLVAIYLSSIISTFILLKYQRRPNGDTGLIFYGLALILMRGVISSVAPISSLGLVLSLLGWLLAQQHWSKNLRPGFEQVAVVIMVWGWFLAVDAAFPWQATVISILLLHYSFGHLQRYGQRRYLLAIFLIGLQSFWLLERLLPLSLREAVNQLWVKYTDSGFFTITIYSFTYFFYLLLFLALTDWLYRRDKQQLALFGEKLALFLGLALLMISGLNSAALSLYSYLISSTLIYLAYRRSNLKGWRVFLAHTTILISIASTLNWQYPRLGVEQWALVALGLMILEWTISKLSSNYLSRSTLVGGWFLAGLSYLWLQQAYPYWGLSWLVTPITLTVLGRYRASCVTLIWAQSLTLGYLETRIVGLAMATVLMFWNSYYFRRQATFLLHYGFGLGLIVAAAWEQIAVADWWLLGGILILGLVCLEGFLAGKSGWAAFYRSGAIAWGIGLGLVTLLALSLRTMILGLSLLSPQWQSLVAIILIAAALIYWQRGRLSKILVYGLVWLSELALVEVIGFAKGDSLTLAIANTLLALASLVLIYSQRSLRTLLLVPLIYSSVALVARFGYFTAATGLITLGIGVTGLGVSYYRSQWKPLTFVSLVTISLGVGELILYQMLVIPSVQTGGIMVTGGLIAAAIALIYLWLSSRRRALLPLEVVEIEFLGNCYWGIAFLVQVLTSLIILPPWRSLILGGLLATYGGAKGRRRDYWIYLAVGNLVLSVLAFRLSSPLGRFLDPWWLLLACGLAILMETLPWSAWGWSARPWHFSAVALPVVAAILTNPATPKLLVGASFYIYIAYKYRQSRWSYFSLAFLDWGITRWLLTQGFDDYFWYSSVLGFSLLYIAEVDPWFKLVSQRHSRHLLRLGGYGAIVVPACIWHQDTGLLPGILGLVGIFLGMALRVRAFLFVGTGALIFTAFYQLIILVFTYSFLKWLIGLSLGILLILIAANFERHRQQIAVLWHHWLRELNHWQ